MKKTLPFIVACLMAAMLFGCSSTQEGMEDAASYDEDEVIYDDEDAEGSEPSEQVAGEKQAADLDKEAAIDGISYSVSSSWSESAADMENGFKAITYSINPETQLTISVNAQEGQHPTSLEELDAAYAAKMERFASTEHPGAEWTDGMAEAITNDGVQGYMRTWDVMYTSQDGADIHEYDQSVEFANEALFVEMKMTVTASGEEAPDIDAAFDIFDEVVGSLLLQKQE